MRWSGAQVMHDLDRLQVVEVEQDGGSGPAADRAQGTVDKVSRLGGCSCPYRSSN